MKIALISTIHNPVTGAAIGGLEVFNYNLANELAKRNELVVFASGDSDVPGELYPVCPKSLFKTDLNPNEAQGMRKLIYLENHYYIKAIEYIKKNHFDIVHHSHTSFLPIYLTYLAKIPQILTIHMTSNSNITLNQDLREIFNNKDEINLVSISNRQRDILNDLNIYKNVYNGIDLNNFTYNNLPEDYSFWMGRIVPNKGLREAIEIAIESNVKLNIAGDIGVGKVVDDYYASVKPLFENNNIKFLGRANVILRNKLLRNAKMLSFPIQWEEPFGLVMIESMAAGTPVIAFARGSVPEIIKDGITGFIINPADDDIRGNWIIKKTGIEGMIEATKRLYSLPEEEYKKMRLSCRAHVEKNFTVEKMVDGYEKIYKEVIADWKKKNKK